MQPDEPTAEEQQQQLPQDGATPFQPAAPNPDPAGATNPVAQAQDDSRLDDTHPVTDTNVQPEEQYDEGVSGAAQAQEPNAGNAVTDYNPPVAQPGQTVSPTNTGSTPGGTDDTPTGTADQQPDVAPGIQPPA